ncbi:MAG: biopolymer transporter ExbD [Polyangiaceae bacterium]
MKHGARRISIKPANRASGDINVTPLVDVVLVLLIIFMVVTPLLEKDINVTVPSTEKVETMTDVPPDQLVVRIEANGDFKLNNVAITPAEYVDRLKERLATRAENDKIVFIQADDAANYPRLVAALDGARKAGAQTLGMATDPPEAPAPAATP